jgi:hypothetical protein
MYAARLAILMCPHSGVACATGNTHLRGVARWKRKGRRDVLMHFGPGDGATRALSISRRTFDSSRSQGSHEPEVVGGRFSVRPLVPHAFAGASGGVPIRNPGCARLSGRGGGRLEEERHDDSQCDPHVRRVRPACLRRPVVHDVSAGAVGLHIGQPTSMPP